MKYESYITEKFNSIKKSDKYKEYKFSKTPGYLTEKCFEYCSKIRNTLVNKSGNLLNLKTIDLINTVKNKFESINLSAAQNQEKALNIITNIGNKLNNILFPQNNIKTQKIKN